MNSRNAFAKDDEFYADDDTKCTGSWGAFGNNTGFCYLLSSEEACKVRAEELNQQKKKNQ
jgi:hypothetical protein